MRRGELLVPDRWKPARNVRVRVLPNPDEPEPPAGVWRILDRSNGEPGPHWWAQPHDDAARRWAQAHPTRIVQSCLEVTGLRCAPATAQLELAPPPPTRGRR